MKNTYFFPIFNGILGIQNKNQVVCNISTQGVVNVKTKKNKRNISRFEKIPFLRGIEFLIFGTFYYFKALFSSTVGSKTIPKTEHRQNKSNIIFTTLFSILAVLSGVVILGVLPTYLGFWLSINNYNLFINKVCIGLLKCLVFYLILIGFYFIPQFNNFYKLNSACNIILNNEEDIFKGHRATNYFNFIVFSLLTSYFVITLIGFSVSPYLKPILNLCVMLFCFALCYEILYSLDGNLIKFKQVCLITSWLVNSRAGATEMQLAKTTFCELNFLNKSKERKMINTEKTDDIPFSLVYSQIKEKLMLAGIEDRAEADWLISIFLGVPKLSIKTLTSITKNQYNELRKLVERRISGEPIAKIFGYTEFYGLRIKVNKNVLTPRQETEILVENALKLIGDDKCTVLDLCTGSGAIAIAIQKTTKASVFASDVSLKALDIAKENAQNLAANIVFIESDMFEGLKKKKFDFIISNPPYIKTEEIEMLQKEVKDYDPHISLDGGIDGLYFYKEIAQKAPLFLSKNGKILLEIGHEQAKEVKKLLTDNFNNIKIIKDYNKLDRVIIAEKK